MPDTSTQTEQCCGILELMSYIKSDTSWICAAMAALVSKSSVWILSMYSSFFSHWTQRCKTDLELHSSRWAFQVFCTQIVTLSAFTWTAQPNSSSKSVLISSRLCSVEIKKKRKKVHYLKSNLSDWSSEGCWHGFKLKSVWAGGCGSPLAKASTSQASRVIRLIECNWIKTVSERAKVVCVWGNTVIDL